MIHVSADVLRDELLDLAKDDQAAADILSAWPNTVELPSTKGRLYNNIRNLDSRLQMLTDVLRYRLRMAAALENPTGDHLPASTTAV